MFERGKQILQEGFYGVLFLGFMFWILTKDGFAINNEGFVYIKEYKYFYNLLEKVKVSLI